MEQRIEVVTPVFDKELQKEIYDVMEFQLQDNTHARFIDPDHINKYVDSPLIRYDKPFEARNILQLSDDMGEALRMMEKVDKIFPTLPGLDCGSCGAPNCHALAEDIVRKDAVMEDCIHILREQYENLLLGKNGK